MMEGEQRGKSAVEEPVVDQVSWMWDSDKFEKIDQENNVFSLR